MLSLFKEEIKVFNRVLTPDGAGGNSISYVESEFRWRVRISPLDGSYTEDSPGREYPSQIRVVGETRDDIREGDRIEHNDCIWEITSLALVNGVGSIPDYIRASAIRVEKGGG